MCIFIYQLGKAHVGPLGESGRKLRMGPQIRLPKNSDGASALAKQCCRYERMGPLIQIPGYAEEIGKTHVGRGGQRSYFTNGPTQKAAEMVGWRQCDGNGVLPKFVDGPM
jgi:hypothetical protein